MTYKTTRYFIPLYFLVFKNKIDYQIIGCFATQDETSETLVETLSIITLWYQKSKPICFLVDNCKEEITAIKTLFPNCIKSVQMQSFLWSLLSCIRTEYRDLILKSPSAVRIKEKKDQKKICIVFLPPSFRVMFFIFIVIVKKSFS